MPISASLIADAVHAGLKARAAEEDREQAVYGLDRLDELALHPLIRKALLDAGLSVWSEQRYPTHWVRRRRSEGLRCDLVLGAEPNLPGLRDVEVRDTLFDRLPACDPEDAYWLEVKTVSQYTIDGPFRRYTAELFSAVAGDLKKLWDDPLIRHAGLLLVLFTAGRVVAEHDLAAWHARCLDRGYPVGSPAIRGFDITDRIGNSRCEVGVFSVRGA